ncbi:ABC transporter ATP-binding protein [Thermaurantimonas aggregans]|uniref:ABC transporter ATP-binding protein n=1 Tax=Thermaurantimonas aggregans TaxID=2173829 RepID=A0A401XKM4_9FLAO|nr:ABC transporter ATP-binding protein [Thermaurantimonas aggregans]
MQGVDLYLKRGEKLGIVGESGSGKSLICKAISGLLPPSLSISFDAFVFQEVSGKWVELDKMTSSERAKNIGYVFQEPMSALNPSMQIGDQIAEALEILPISKNEKQQRALEWLQKVQISYPEATYYKYPHQLSGGQRQRVVIAMAMIKNPHLLVADEPTTALDLLVQAEIIRLLRRLCDEEGTSLIFVSHDIDLVGQLCDQILVMRQGKMIEIQPKDQLFTSPTHPYTQALLLSRPKPGYKPKRLPTVEDFLLSHSDLVKVSKKQTLKESELLKKNKNIITISNLSKSYQIGNKKSPILRNVNLTITSGETVGIVGPSGCGKTTLARILCGIEKVDAGKVQFHQAGRRADVVQLVFQDPFSSLNPMLTIGKQVMDPLLAKGISAVEAKEKAQEILDMVGISVERFNEYPHLFSGGQRQRIAIARALILRPSLVVLDESVSALDVSVQAQVLNLLNDLKDALNVSYLFITHNLIIAEYFCNRICVMYNGEIVEEWTDKMPENPVHPFTRQLKEAIVNF